MATESAQTIDVSLATGRSHKLPLVPVLFRVHEDLKYLDPDLLAQNQASVEGKPAKSILPAAFRQALQSWPASQSLEKNGWGKPKVADDRWVYVFRARAWGGVTLDSEIQVKAEGDQQSCKCVSWVPADKQKWVKQFPRPASVNKKVFYLASDDQHFVLLSDFQLPYKRIDFYTTSKGQSALKRRALEIPKGALSQVDKLPAQIDLVDARLIAKKAHARAKKAREDYLKFTGDETTAAKRYIADFLWQISKKEEKVDKWVAMGEVEAFRQDQEKKLRKLLGTAESEEAFFYAWMLTGPFREGRDDAFASDEKDFEPLEKAWLEEESELLEDTLASRYGLEYLKEEGEENTWFNRMFLGGGESYSVKKSLLSLDDGKLGELLNKFLIGRVLWRMKGAGLTTTKITFEKVVEMQGEILLEMELVVQRLRLPLANFGQRAGKYFWLETDRIKKVTRINYEAYRIEAKFKSIPTKEWNEAIEKIDKVSKYLVLALEVGNLLHCLSEYRNASNGSERFWSNGEILSAFSDSIQALGKLVKATLKKIGAEIAVAWLGIAGALIDVVLNTRKAVLNLGKGRYGVAGGYALTALSSVALGVGATLEMFEGAMFLGMAAFPWMLIGGLLLILGTALIYLFTESDLEEWAKNCCWGKRGNRQSGKSELGKQVYNLQEILSKFKIDCYVAPGEILSESIGASGSYTEYQYYLVLCIEAGMFLDGKSRFKVRLDAKDVTVIFEDSIFINHKEKELLIPETVTPAKPEGEGEAEEGGRKFYKRWKLNDSQAAFRANNGKYKYDLVARLDLNGDGKTLLPSEPVIQNGTCEYKPPWKR